ncbi:hypothetical protein BC937DRAFT_90256 [Endogone sp. FLAS-F59071]|nr:hypothetical protein BC937DRAFT_90256 [Endogone sp. FLAS-F59071]|eukprot:RUS17212.1 hypothetical protein BC937DRAFT_90256 [Endogone sp. FLAS-F59071]
MSTSTVQHSGESSDNTPFLSDSTPLLSDPQNEVHDLRAKPAPAGVAWQSTAWLWLVWSWRFVIFAVTGSTSVAVTRAIMKYVLGMKGWTLVYLTLDPLPLDTDFPHVARVHCADCVDRHPRWAAPVLCACRMADVGMGDPCTVGAEF